MWQKAHTRLCFFSLVCTKICPDFKQYNQNSAQCDHIRLDLKKIIVHINATRAALRQNIKKFNKYDSLKVYKQDYKIIQC